MGVPARISLVTLGISDVGRAERFYRALGWDVRAAADDGLRVFDTAGPWLALYPVGSLAADADVPPPSGSGFRGLTLAVNVATPSEVDEALRTAAEAGGTVVRAAERAEWGGYVGYFADPDGHVWEVAHNPAWPLDESGRPVIP
ncbi:VOC family protein [Longimycelium tulufanense]|nr:VOC family protein [Longimycelium tulufanense]